MKRIWCIPALALLLSGCVPSEEAETVENEEAETALIPSIQLDEQYYRTLLPYKESAARGMIVNRLNTRYDIEEAGTGLMRLAQRQFSPDDYYFQEGQQLTADEIRAWLGRKSADNPEGLNPADERTAEQKEGGTAPPPEVLAHIIEQNYLVKTDEDTISLGGIAIGLALNSVYYSKDGSRSAEESIPENELTEAGKRIADEVAKRLRQKEGLADVPIVVGLFRQNERNAIVPGSYIAVGTVPPGKTEAGNWQPVQEEHIIFPTSNPAEKYRETDTAFRNFEQDVQEYFSDFTSVVGTGYYEGEALRELKIEIPVQFYSATEVIGFTQYVTGLLGDHFQNNALIEISIVSANGPEALVVREAGAAEPDVHIYR
ncbi:CamS family sex pheromone protein [Indiicoccus explosivorum]|uniref:CamS family sex pheromone protein n=1 Tax=Indiicoccus explosivorum TaxID=1917864 RepID=UPI000B44DAC6|nr:CamS family sex pheromone protein [Indiicoccus explosivorum]